MNRKVKHILLVTLIFGIVSAKTVHAEDEENQGREVLKYPIEHK